MGHAPELSVDPITADLEQRLARLRAAFEAEPYPSAAVRKDRLKRAIASLLKHEKRIVDAINTDFGNRAEPTTLLADVMVPIRALRHALKNVERWMKPERRKSDFPLGLIGARSYIFYQPLGVIGIVSPWNAPLGLAYTPLAGALAAGNRALIKPSELTPATSQLLAEIIADTFSNEEVDLVQGGVDVATRFTALPFDHLVFTGSTRTAKTVMRAAAEHLVPVTLELGGKAPTIVAHGSDLDYAASKIIGIKLTNAGQICMGPDHVLVHRQDRDRFVAAVEAVVRRFYPDYATSPDVTCVPLANQRRRLASLVEDAEQRGAKIIVTSGAQIDQLADMPRFPLVIVVDPPQDCALMREEIFGPILPVLSYDSLESAVQRIRRSGIRPLALYHIGGSSSEQQYLIRNTHAGGMTFDDVMLHPLMQDLPFGGVGESGMGRYVGHAGFLALSNGKSIAHRPWIDITRYLQPPYPPAMTKLMRWALKL
jgi:coniferyl-aldehyde dehydrogenase